MEDLHLIAKIYEAYSSSKEKFIDRNFQTNRFFMVLCLVMIFATYAAKVLAPDLMCVVILSAFGLLVSILWWINLDTYQFMIKIKYANVLERIEDHFPVKPCQDEYKESLEVKKKNKLVVFADLQKYFALLMIVVFLSFFCFSTTSRIVKPPFEATDTIPQVEVIE